MAQGIPLSSILVCGALHTLHHLYNPQLPVMLSAFT